jgi:hypothetical protein
MEFIYRLTPHPAAFEVKYAKKQARVDGIINGKALHRLISIYPACGPKIIFEFTQVPTGLLDIFLNIKIGGSEGEDDLGWGRLLDRGRLR